MGVFQVLRAACAIVAVVLTPAVSQAASAAAEGISSIGAYVNDHHLEKLAGFLTVYRSLESGAAYLEIPADGGPDVLYQSILTSGLGSRELVAHGGADALDRGRLGSEVVAAFRVFGPRVLLIARNTNYYTPSAPFNSVNDAGLSFPNAVVMAFDVKARDSGSVLIDATALFQRDGNGVAEALRASGQGDFSYDETRTVLDVARLHTTQDSIEVDALLGFTADKPASSDSVIGRLAADPASVIVQERNALVRLPDLQQSAFRPRMFEPRSGFFDITYKDPTALPESSGRRSWILRHDLRKKDPSQQVSDPVKPIVFYIDPAVPSTVRSLIAEAAAWWNPAFEAAGFSNALQVRDLPPDVDPFDSGVNVILWVPRESRGFSFGGSIADPRTGQVLKAVIRLDAMRLQADRLLFDALTAPYGDHPDLDERDQALRDRFRLLVAHEIGHTLGLAHQFAGSAQPMSSVMEYPFPEFLLGADGRPSLHHLFPQEIGGWDKAAILYGYAPFAPADEEAKLRALIDGNERAGVFWLTDQDTGGADPRAEKWDRGTDPIAELARVLALRRAALGRFSRAVIPAEQPLAELQEALSPLFFLHQFELRAVAAMLGGYSYSYAMRDEKQPVPVPAARQRQALEAVLSTLDAATLWPGSSVIALMTPWPPGYVASPEAMKGDTGQTFDALRPIEDAAVLTMTEILQPERAARLSQAATRETGSLTLNEVLSRVVTYTWEAEPQREGVGAAQKTIALAVLSSLVQTSTLKTAPMTVRGACWAAIDQLSAWLHTHPATPEWRDAYAFANHVIAAADRGGELPPAAARHAPVLEPMGLE